MEKVRGSAVDAAKAGGRERLHSRIMPSDMGQHGTTPTDERGGEVFDTHICLLPPACGEHMITSSLSHPKHVQRCPVDVQ